MGAINLATVLAFAFVTQGYAGLLLQGTVPAPGSDKSGGSFFYEPAPAPAPQIPSIIEPPSPPVGQVSTTNDVRFVFAGDVQPNPLDSLVVSVQDSLAANATMWQSVSGKGSTNYIPTNMAYTPPAVYSPAQAAPPITTSPLLGAPGLDGFLDTPEPATFGYLALALAAFAVRRRLAR